MFRREVAFPRDSGVVAAHARVEDMAERFDPPSGLVAIAQVMELAALAEETDRVALLAQDAHHENAQSEPEQQGQWQSKCEPSQQRRARSVLDHQGRVGDGR